MNISHKLHVSALQTECLTFLLTHAAGRPIKAMRIAELFDEEELYRESSRFVLDNPGGWSEEELGTLSQATLLKLEKRYVIRVIYDILVHSMLTWNKANMVPGTSTEAWISPNSQRVPMRAYQRRGPLARSAQITGRN